jgi:hypothetical protein
MNKTEKKIFEKVKALTWARVKSAVASGKKLEAGSWSKPSRINWWNELLPARVCAVGAICFNGDPNPMDPAHYDVYVMASKQLKEVGIPSKYYGVILDGISEGFEGAGRPDSHVEELLRLYATKGSRGLDKRSRPLYPAKLRATPLFEACKDLGRQVWKKYGIK